MEMLTVQSPASLPWTPSAGAPQLTSSRATSLSKVSHLEGTSDANQTARKARDDGLEPLVETQGKPQSLVQVSRAPCCCPQLPGLSTGRGLLSTDQLLEECCGNLDYRVTG